MCLRLYCKQHDDVLLLLMKRQHLNLQDSNHHGLPAICDWTPKMIKKAVVNMALKLKKPVLSLTNTDYNEYGLSDLLVEKGDAYEINLQVYYMLRDTITGWPGGKPNVNLPTHPERSEPYPKRMCHLLSSP